MAIEYGACALHAE